MTAKFRLKDKFTKKTITQNIGLKLMSLAVAVILWFIVVNLTDPVITQTYKNVPVRILNADIITDDAKTLEVVDDTAVVPSVTIKASRTTIQELGNSIDSIVATADMKDLSADGKSVSIEFTTTKLSDKIDSIRPSTSTLYVNIENKKTIQLPINATTSGEIESGYILGSVAPNQNQVRISGPESVVSRIKSASVDVQVTGFTGNISTQADINVFDEEGEPISEKSLSLNVESVRVDVEILATKRVPVYYSTSGVPADGYAVTGEVECNPEAVVIAGSQAVIDSTSEISIPSSDLNVTGQSENMMLVVDLADYLPAGTRFADANFNSKASITVFIEPFVEDTYNVYLRNIKFEDVPAGFEAEFASAQDDVEFTLIGLAQDLEKLQLSSLNYRVDFGEYSLAHDVTEFKEGTYSCDVSFDLPEGITLKEPVKMSVKLTKKD